MTARNGQGSTPEISVVVPTYRRSERLPRLVAALEAQTLDPARFEVLIVDNGSGDETSALLADLAAHSPLRLRPLVIDDNRGPARARNLGWRSTEAPFVAYTDDDCVPVPEWLERGLFQLEADERVGVVQGRTEKPDVPGYPWTDWTVYREILWPSPYFEGCNLFFRREALEATGGFDESIPFGGEDTAAGWGVLAAGWQRVFEQDAVVRHDLVERGVRWHMTMAWREGNLLGVARKYPQLRSGFWRPWALRPQNLVFATGVIGTLLAARRRPALLLWLPWLWMRRPPRGHHRYLRLYAERFAVDASVFAGMAAASVKHRQLVL